MVQSMFNKGEVLVSIPSTRGRGGVREKGEEENEGEEEEDEGEDEESPRDRIES